MTKCLDELNYSAMCFGLQSQSHFVFDCDSILRLSFDSIQEFFQCMCRVREGCFFFDRYKELNTSTPLFLRVGRL